MVLTKSEMARRKQPLLLLLFLIMMLHSDLLTFDTIASGNPK